MTFPKPSCYFSWSNCFWLDVWLVAVGLKYRKDRRERKLKRNKERDKELEKLGELDRDGSEEKKRSVWRWGEIRQGWKKCIEKTDVKSEKDKAREAKKETVWGEKVATKRGRKTDRQRKTDREREMIRFLPPLYGSGQELPFQSNLAQTKVNNQSW